ncbi:hypothetical protein EDB80DRAFT_65241 [Ilyonectria destructans]|nr:hypothetical protein EDB80DRAFT_65241 [Ilyonectria destructans]
MMPAERHYMPFAVLALASFGLVLTGAGASRFPARAVARLTNISIPVEGIHLLRTSHMSCAQARARPASLARARRSWRSSSLAAASNDFSLGFAS